MAQNTKTTAGKNSSNSEKSDGSQALSRENLSLSGQLQITNPNQIRTQLDSLTKKRFVELEVKLTGEGADLLKNPQIRTGPVTVQTSSATSGMAPSKKSLFDSSAQNRMMLAVSNSIARDAGEGLNAPLRLLFQ